MSYNIATMEAIVADVTNMTFKIEHTLNRQTGLGSAMFLGMDSMHIYAAGQGCIYYVGIVSMYICIAEKVDYLFLASIK